ncbi:hypothetical protein SAMN05216342_2351 [Exiguobacterium indicum]|nr:hypothetical protein SAMN05216342_2351 [Exiguobacterium enclense]
MNLFHLQPLYFKIKLSFVRMICEWKGAFCERNYETVGRFLTKPTNLGTLVLVC